ncbi:Rhodanese-related sulfurtransferase [Carnobacterium iners]|uniref:Rhodanese-related sulfurtransferase n=1 Tax=Carnobacterium iners TaxID=1073423 RepID=A0A1X7NIF3_9LACT|nr:rhodanese-like domain-containing protein [Carnobacterium iners]SEK65607.1 Rhodanese-related sulfurtransferase [Carnobacterium iners]SMH37570.1 Rhodanese-related sulfurtransferase [Carnobacterium iners]
MNINVILNAVLLVVVIIWGGYELFQYFNRKRASVELTEEEFKKEMRRVQLIDVREKSDFDAGHILGARNIPYSLFKTRMVEIRKDQPVYLYDHNKTLSSRAAVKLHKIGYTELYRLKGGFRDWTGKTKKHK